MSDRRNWGRHISPDFARARGRVLVGTSDDHQQSCPVICGARTRKGTPCKAKAVPGKTRCRFHGGLSTGPRTTEGRERIAAAQRKRWAEWRQSRSGQSSASSES